MQHCGHAGTEQAWGGTCWAARVGSRAVSVARKCEQGRVAARARGAGRSRLGIRPGWWDRAPIPQQAASCVRSGGTAGHSHRLPLAAQVAGGPSPPLHSSNRLPLIPATDSSRIQASSGRVMRRAATRTMKAWQHWPTAAAQAPASGWPLRRRSAAVDCARRSSSVDSCLHACDRSTAPTCDLRCSRQSYHMI